MESTHFVVRRDRLTEHEIVTTSRGPLAPGDAELRVDLFGFTANNVTYAVRGDLLAYWKFFPEPRPGWGRIPVWGFGTVVRSAAEGVAVGERVYGYFPMSSHLIVQPKQIDAGGFFDGTPHRQDFNAVFNQYLRPARDPQYHPDTELHQVVLRPLFGSSYFLADYLREHDFFDAEVTLVSSASSKLASCMAWNLADVKRDRRKILGLTSECNAAFVRRLGLYDRVITYPEVATLPGTRRAVFLDIAGSVTLRTVVHNHFGNALRHSLIVGATHQEPLATNTKLPGPEPVPFFAPTWIRRRFQQWTPAEANRRLAEAWRGYLVSMQDPARGWLTILSSTGAAAVAQAYDDLVGGRARPEHGHVFSLAAGTA